MYPLEMAPRLQPAASHGTLFQVRGRISPPSVRQVSRNGGSHSTYTNDGQHKPFVPILQSAQTQSVCQPYCLKFLIWQRSRALKCITWTSKQTRRVMSSFYYYTEQEQNEKVREMPKPSGWFFQFDVPIQKESCQLHLLPYLIPSGDQ